MNKVAQDDVCYVFVDLLEELNDPQKKNDEVLYYLFNLIQPASINFTVENEIASILQRFERTWICKDIY